MNNNQKDGQKNIPRSILSAIAGIATTFILSYGTDYILQAFGVFKADQKLPLTGADGLILIILAYRSLYVAVGSYVTAWLAPRRPMKHVLILGILGLVFSILGAIGGMQMALGPSWYLWGLVVLSFPAALLGGYLYVTTKKAK